MDDLITFLETKEQALAAGVPEELFDPEVHLHKSVTVVSTPAPEVLNATPAENQPEA